MEPAEEQLPAGLGPREAPDVRAEEQEAREGHGHGLIVVESEVPKVRQVVPGPGGGHPLRPRHGAPGHVEGRLHPRLHGGFPAGPGHEVGEQGPDAAGGQGATEAGGHHVAVPYVVFVVVVPDIQVPPVHQLFPDAPLPEAVGSGVSEIEIAGHAPPEGELGWAAVGQLQKPAVMGDGLI